CLRRGPGSRRGGMMALFSARKPPTPLDGVDLLLADLAGVVYASELALPHAVESLDQGADTRRLAFITNNAARTDQTVAAQLPSLGLTVLPEEVVTSPQAAARLLAETVRAPAVVLVVGGEGLVVELERAGYTVTRSASDGPAAVVQGF